MYSLNGIKKLYAVKLRSCNLGQYAFMVYTAIELNSLFNRFSSGGVRYIRDPPDSSKLSVTSKH